MSEEDSTVIYVTRPYGKVASSERISRYLKKIGTPMHRGIRKDIEVSGESFAICDTFCIDSYVDRMRLQMMLNKAELSDHFYIEVWSDIAEQDLTEHACFGYSERNWTTLGYEWFTTSKHPDVTPEYLTEDYAVAFLSDSAEGDVLDTCSFTCRKW